MGLTVVTGPPCAGKSTYVDAHRQPGDVVIDFDRIAVALGADTLHTVTTTPDGLAHATPTSHVDWSTSSAHRTLARDIRARLVRTLIADMKRDGPTGYGVWLVDAAPKGWQRTEYRRVGAAIVDLDPGREVCHVRARDAGRSVATHGEIERWYAEAANR